MPGGEFAPPDGAGPRVVNNTFVANRTAVRLYRAVPTATQVYRNNLIAGNTTGVEASGGTDADNPVWQNNRCSATARITRGWPTRPARRAT